MDQKKVIEKWLEQIKLNEIQPEALGLNSDKDKAIETLRNQLNQLSYQNKIRR